MNFLIFLLINSVYGFFNFFNQQQQAPPERSYEDLVLNSDCREYVCPGTRQCVKSSVDCDCPFPSSQMKCMMPDGKHYVCVSKPAIVDEASQKIYDTKGNQGRVKGVRDCGWAVDAWNGKV